MNGTELKGKIGHVEKNEALECLEEIIEHGKYLLGQTPNEFGENGTPHWFDEKADTIKQVLIQTENCSGARRNGKALEQMYQLVNCSKAPMKPAIWVAKIDDKLEQRVIMEKEDYDTKSKKVLALDIAKEKNVDLGMVDFFDDVENYNEYLTLQPNESRKPLSEYEFKLIKQ